MIISTIIVFAWFPILREFLTHYTKSLYCSLAFVQAMGIYSSFDIPLSTDLQTLFRGLGLFNLNLDAVHLACATDGGGMTYVDMWLIKMLLPCLGPVGFLLHFAITSLINWTATNVKPLLKILLKMGWRPRSDRNHRKPVQTYLPPGLFFLNMYYISALAAATEMLNCNSNPDGGEYLRADPQVTCWKLSLIHI